MDTRQQRDDEILERLRQICLAFPEADEATLQDRPLFHVHRKRFAIFNSDQLTGADGTPVRARTRWAGSGCSLHFLADPTEHDALQADPRFTPSPHHGDRGWFTLGLPPSASGPRVAGGTSEWQEVAELLEAAYRTAAPRRLVDQLDARPRTFATGSARPRGGRA